MEYFITVIWTTIDLIAIYLFCKSFLSCSASNGKILFVFTMQLAAHFSKTLITIQAPMVQIVSFAVMLLGVHLLFNGKIYQKLFILLLAALLISMLDMIALYSGAALMGISLDEFVWRIYAYSAIGTVSKLTTLFLFWMIYRLRRGHAGSPIRGSWLLLSLPFPAASIVIAMMFYLTCSQDEDLSLPSVVCLGILVVANIAILYLIQIMERNTKKAEEMALLRQQMDIQTDSILALEQNYRSQRRATHEFNNQLQTILALLDRGDAQEARAYVEQLKNIQSTRLFPINSHHPVVDAVLNHKSQTAKEQQIDMQVRVNDLSAVDIPTDHLVVLLSNLLDNAIEACLKLPDKRVVHCQILKTDILFISVRNTSLPVIIENDSIKTDKDRKELHGYGLAGIRHILNELGGEYTFAYEDGWFEFVAEIP